MLVQPKIKKLKKKDWLYVYARDFNYQLPDYLPKQARDIANILKDKGALKRDILLAEMQNVVKTKQIGGANRILTYYQNLLWNQEKIIEVRKTPD
tara:strand:+ start:2082 stop:2366 length:285 start_codon:yes stop_codon:yes gene_type:complete